MRHVSRRFLIHLILVAFVFKQGDGPQDLESGLRISIIFNQLIDNFIGIGR